MAVRVFWGDVGAVMVYGGARLRMRLRTVWWQIVAQDAKDYIICDNRYVYNQSNIALYIPQSLKNPRFGDLFL